MNATRYTGLAAAIAMAAIAVANVTGLITTEQASQALTWLSTIGGRP